MRQHSDHGRQTDRRLVSLTSSYERDYELTAYDRRVLARARARRAMTVTVQHTVPGR